VNRINYVPQNDVPQNDPMNPMNPKNPMNPSNPMTNLPCLGVLHTACDSDPGIVAERKKGF